MFVNQEELLSISWEEAYIPWHSLPGQQSTKTRNVPVSAVISTVKTWGEEMPRVSFLFIFNVEENHHLSYNLFPFLRSPSPFLQVNSMSTDLFFFHIFWPSVLLSGTAHRTESSNTYLSPSFNSLKFLPFCCKCNISPFFVTEWYSWAKYHILFIQLSLGRYCLFPCVLSVSFNRSFCPGAHPTLASIYKQQICTIEGQKKSKLLTTSRRVICRVLFQAVPSDVQGHWYEARMQSTVWQHTHQNVNQRTSRQVH